MIDLKLKNLTISVSNLAYLKESQKNFSLCHFLSKTNENKNKLDTYNKKKYVGNILLLTTKKP